MVTERVGSLAWLRKQLEAADKDLLREMERIGCDRDHIHLLCSATKALSRAYL